MDGPCPRLASNSHRAKGAFRELFVSAKTTSPITIRSALAALALVQSTLGHSVFGISPGFALAGHDGSTIDVDAVLSCADASYALIVDPTPSADLDLTGIARDLAENSLRLLALRESDILREPHASNARLVWESGEVDFSASDQIRVLNHLTEYGPSPIIDLASETSTEDGPAAIMAMCRLGVLDLDLLDRPLGPYTRASCRSSA